MQPGGLLALTTPNARWEERYKAGTHRLQPIENWLTPEALVQLLMSAGFEVIDLATFGVHWSNMPYRTNRLYALLKKVGRRLGAWNAVEDFESWVARCLGRGIGQICIARLKPSTSAEAQG